MVSLVLSERRPLLRKRRLDSLLETVAGYVLLLAANVVWASGDIGWLDTVLHPYFVVTMLIAARYGTVDGVISGAIGAVLYTWFLFESDPSAFASAHVLLDLNVMATPYLLLLLGTVLGELRQVCQDEIDELWMRYRTARGDLDHLSTEARTVRQDNDNLLERIASSTRTTSAFYDAASQVQTLDEEDALPSILEIVQRFVGAEKCSIYARGPQGWQLRVHRGWSDGHEFPRTIDAENVVLKRVAQGRVVTMKDAPLDLESTDIVMAAPLFHGEGEDKQVYGAIAVQRIPFGSMSVATVQNLEGVSRWGSRVLNAAESYGRARERDPADAVTGAYRYPYMLNRLEEEIGRWRRYETPASLLLVQVVNFDRVPRVKRAAFLRRVGKVVLRNTRQVDLVSRWRGADTFALVLPSTDGQGTRKLSARIHDQFTREILPHVPKSAQLSLRFGIAAVGEHGEGRDELIRVAERLEVSEA